MLTYDHMEICLSLQKFDRNLTFMYTFRHSALMYGNFKTKPNAIDEKAAKMARLSKMKKIYLPPRLSPSK